jgi:hypothetical protein
MKTLWHQRRRTEELTHGFDSSPETMPTRA